MLVVIIIGTKNGENGLNQSGKLGTWAVLFIWTHFLCFVNIKEQELLVEVFSSLPFHPGPSPIHLLFFFTRPKTSFLIL